MTGFKLEFRAIDRAYVEMRNYDSSRTFYGGPNKSITTNCIGRSCDAGCKEFLDIKAPIN